MKKIVFLLLLVVFLSACNLNKAPDEPKKNLLLNATDKDVVSDLTYNELLSYKLEPSNTPGYYKTGQEGKIIEWSAKISKHYSQITGIKFCVLDNNHQNVDITKPCDMFWAFSDNRNKPQFTVYRNNY